MKQHISVDQGKLLIRTEKDMQPVLDRAAALRSADRTGFSENWLVGSIDAFILEGWLKEAGVAWSDTEAVREVLTRKLMDGDFARFRIKEGDFR